MLISFTSKAAGYVSPFYGPLAGIATYLIMKNVWRTLHIESDAICYHPAGTDANLNIFKHGAAIPLFQVPTNPIGRLKNGQLLLSESGIRDMFTSVAETI